MNGESLKIRSFTDLHAWQEAHALVVAIYTLTKLFPKEELFGLTSQVRRAAISVPSNIAEGFSRGSYKERHQFYSIARGSLTEVQSQLLIARDVHYINRDMCEKLFLQTETVSRIINGLMKSTKALC